MIEYVADRRMNRSERELWLLRKDFDGRESVKDVPDIDVMHADSSSRNAGPPPTFLGANFNMSGSNDLQEGIITQPGNPEHAASKRGSHGRFFAARIPYNRF